VTDEQDSLSIQVLAVPASVSASRSQKFPFVLPMLASQSKCVGQTGLASAMPSHSIKNTANSQASLQQI